MTAKMVTSTSCVSHACISRSVKSTLFLRPSSSANTTQAVPCAVGNNAQISIHREPSLAGRVSVSQHPPQRRIWQSSSASSSSRSRSRSSSSSSSSRSINVDRHNVQYHSFQSLNIDNKGNTIHNKTKKNNNELQTEKTTRTEGNRRDVSACYSRNSHHLSSDTLRRIQIGTKKSLRSLKIAVEKVDIKKASLLICLFFCLAFNNAIVDSMKDSLIVTSAGGAEQLPFLTVYAVLPASALFVVVFNRMSKTMNRSNLFYLTLGPFVAFFAIFAFVLYPNVDTLHASLDVSTSWLSNVPYGLQPAISMIHNWTYTLFYTFSELWGDVGLSLLFWGMANELTTVDEAKVVYPIFGFGANVAYTCAGALMGTLGRIGMAWNHQLRFLMSTFLVMSLCAALIHSFLGFDKPSSREGRQQAGGDTRTDEELKPKAKTKNLSLMSIFQKPEIGFLAIISVVQGVAFSIFQVCWKSQILNLCSSPASYNAMMANVQIWSGLTSAVFFLAAPAVFHFFGWFGAAVTTPIVLATGGTVYLLASSTWSANPVTALPIAILGSSIYIFMKAAKFSLFKPSEEMVYINLDQDSKTAGKAAVDVLGAQAGKAGGSCVQQMFLLCYQSLAGAMLPLISLHCAMVSIWLVAVRALSKLRTSRKVTAESVVQ